jgi:hypothetical protein
VRAESNHFKRYGTIEVGFGTTGAVPRHERGIMVTAKIRRVPLDETEERGAIKAPGRNGTRTAFANRGSVVLCQP